MFEKRQISTTLTGWSRKRKFFESEGTVVKNPLPSYKTVQRSLRPAVELNLGARSYDIVYNRQTNPIRRYESNDNFDRDVETKVRIVLISEYTRLDVSFPKFLSASNESDLRRYQNFNADFLSYQNLTDASTPGSKHWDCIDDWNLIANRTAFYSEGDSVHATGGSATASSGMYRIDMCSTHVTLYKFMNRAYERDTIALQCNHITQYSPLVATLFQRSDPNDNSTLLLVGKITTIEIASNMASCAICNINCNQHNDVSSGSTSHQRCNRHGNENISMEGDRQIIQTLSNLLQNGSHIACSKETC